jgi:hypothetical protein
MPQARLKRPWQASFREDINRYSRNGNFTRHCSSMMERIVPKRQASSVARQILSPKSINNLQAGEKIFFQSVALLAGVKAN